MHLCTRKLQKNHFPFFSIVICFFGMLNFVQHIAESHCMFLPVSGRAGVWPTIIDKIKLKN